MKLVVVSTNPLFAEVLNAALEGQNDFEITVVAPGEFTEILANIEPEVIIVDESLERTECELILAAAREKTSSHIILLNPKDNSACVLDSRRTIIQEIADLRQAIVRERVNTCASTPEGKDAKA